MSNILIIKHGSLGDLIQANGAMEDIKKSNRRAHIVLLTSDKYSNFMKSCPYISEVIVDARSPRWNLIYLNKLKKKLELNRKKRLLRRKQKRKKKLRRRQRILRKK